MANKQLFSHSFYRLGSFAYRHRKGMVLSWLALLVVLSVFTIKLPGLLAGSGFEMPGEAATVIDILHEDFDVKASQVIVLFESNALKTGQDDFQHFVQTTLTQLAEDVQPDAIRSPYENPYLMQENLAYAVVEFDHSPDDLHGYLGQIRAALANLPDTLATLPITTSITGDPVFKDDIKTTSQRDLLRAELIGVPAALIILLFAFGGLIAAMVPLMIGMVTVVVAMGVLYWFGMQMDLSIFLLNVVPMIGLALSIDFALLLVNRFREELESSHDNIQDSVATSVATAGRAVAISGLCVLLGLSALLLLQVEIFRTVALGGIIVVLLAVISAVTFLPAVLGLLGQRVNKLMLFKRRNNHPAAWYAFAQFVMKRPVLMMSGAIGVLVIALLPIRGIEFTIPETSTIPASYESRIAYETIEAAFGKSELYPVVMIAEMPSEVMENNQLEQLYALVTALEADEQVMKVGSIFSYTGSTSVRELNALYQEPASRAAIASVLSQFVSGNKTVLHVFLEGDPISKSARDWVRVWDEKTFPFTLLIGGKTKQQQEIYDDIYQKAPIAFGWILFSTFIILAFSFHSIFIPIKAILMNILSLGATFGILVWIFQAGHLTGLLQFEPDAIAIILPIFIFSVVFGLSMDYEVFLISRIHERYLATKDNDQAVLLGLTTTSRIITSAAAIIIVITGAFAFTEIAIVKQMGVGIALAIFIDATIVRMVLVPSVMKLMGKWNWWPSRA